MGHDLSTNGFSFFQLCSLLFPEVGKRSKSAEGSRMDGEIRRPRQSLGFIRCGWMQGLREQLRSAIVRNLGEACVVFLFCVPLTKGKVNNWPVGSKNERSQRVSVPGRCLGPEKCVGLRPEGRLNVTNVKS
jgi:hypothetical protein